MPEGGGVGEPKWEENRFKNEDENEDEEGLSWGPLGSSWALLVALLARLGGPWPLENPREDAQERARAPRKFGILGPQTLEY